MVELLRRYSNRSDLLDDLNRTIARLEGDDKTPADEEQPDDLVSSCRHNPRERLLSERLAADDIAMMMERYRAGATIQEVATKFKIGRTSFKHLLRKHGERKKDRG